MLCKICKEIDTEEKSGVCIQCQAKQWIEGRAGGDKKKPNKKK